MVKELTLDATVENVTVVTEFVDEQLERINCPLDIQYLIDIAVDELFGNIAKYAYKDKIGKATLKVEVQDGIKSVNITFVDKGIPFNPLERKEPDIELSADERLVGGLGIHLVKTNVDEMEYEYKDDKNILTIKKNWE